MNPWLQIAIRNLARNRRRSIFTILAIGAGFAAINVFAGFTEYVFICLRDGFIYTDANGHLTIYKKDFLTDSQMDPKKYLLTPAEIEAIKSASSADGRALLVTPKLYVTGMLSNGHASTIAMSAGVVPEDVMFINSRATGTIAHTKIFTGDPLSDSANFNVGAGTLLAAKLKLGLGSDAVLMAPTVEGQMNALDVKIVQTFDGPVDVLNDKLMIVPLSFARTLYDTQGADRMCVLLKQTDDTDAFRESLTRTLAAKGIAIETKSWYELSDMYVKTKKMFDVIFLFLFVIVVFIVVLSVINTVSMSVMERIQEIGTLRSLGLKQRGIVRLFALESGMLGLFGCLLGLVFTFNSWATIKLMHPTWIPPALSRRVPLEVYLVPRYFIFSSLALIVLAIFCAVFPARKAAGKNIVEALGHV